MFSLTPHMARVCHSSDGGMPNRGSLLLCSWLCRSRQHVLGLEQATKGKCVDELDQLV